MEPSSYLYSHDLILASSLVVSQLLIPRRRVLHQVIGFDGALTTLELLPAVLNSPVADELLTSPTFDALMQAKWQLLRPFWQLEVGLFLLCSLTFVAHSMLADGHSRLLLSGTSAVFALPLLWTEYRQYSLPSVMAGVSRGKLAKTATYLDLGNCIDVSGHNPPV